MVRKEDIYYDSRDNRTKVHAISWVPQKGEIKGILQIVHGMAEQIEDYEKFAEFMGEKGFIVVGNDHLGHGETVNAEKGKGYFCAKDGATVLVRDVHRLKKMIQNAYPGRAYIILGYGMGSLIVQKYIMEYGKGIDGAILMGTCRKSDSFLGREGLRLKFLTKLRGDNYRSEWMKKRMYMPCEESSFSISQKIDCSVSPRNPVKVYIFCLYALLASSKKRFFICFSSYLLSIGIKTPFLTYRIFL